MKLLLFTIIASILQILWLMLLLANAFLNARITPTKDELHIIMWQYYAMDEK